MHVLVNELSYYLPYTKITKIDYYLTLNFYSSSGKDTSKYYVDTAVKLCTFFF